MQLVQHLAAGHLTSRDVAALAASSANGSRPSCLLGSSAAEAKDRSVSQSVSQLINFLSYQPSPARHAVSAVILACTSRSKAHAALLWGLPQSSQLLLPPI